MINHVFYIFFFFVFSFVLFLTYFFFFVLLIMTSIFHIDYDLLQNPNATQLVKDPKVTFVTSLFNIYNKDYDVNKTLPKRIEKIREIARLGIPICIYVSTGYMAEMLALVVEFPNNLRIMRVYDSVYSTCLISACESPKEMSLPISRFESKDTIEYMYLMNCKAEFVHEAIISNPFNTEHFAWMDFSLSHVFRGKAEEKQKALDQIRDIAVGHFSQTQHTMMVIPGCWKFYNFNTTPEEIADLSFVSEVHWRFCGGFFMGDAASLTKFYDLHMKYFPIFMATNKTVIWEVNFWVWLECAVPEFRSLFEWYKADHSESIVTNIPKKYKTQSKEPQKEEVPV